MASEYVSLAVVKELDETQEILFKQFIGFHTSSVKEEITSLRKYVYKVKTSLVFSQRDIDDIKEKYYRAEERIMDVEDSMASAQSELEEFSDQQEYLENYGR